MTAYRAAVRTLNSELHILHDALDELRQDLPGADDAELRQAIDDQLVHVSWEIVQIEDAIEFLGGEVAPRPLPPPTDGVRTALFRLLQRLSGAGGLDGPPDGPEHRAGQQSGQRDEQPKQPPEGDHGADDQRADAGAENAQQQNRDQGRDDGEHREDHACPGKTATLGCTP